MRRAGAGARLPALARLGGRRCREAASRAAPWPSPGPPWDRPAGIACRADRPGSPDRPTAAGRAPSGAARRWSAETAWRRLPPVSTSKRYMPVVRSIFSRGPAATSLPRETTTWSTSSTVLALMSKVAQSPVAVCPSLEVISTFCLASTRVSCDGRLVGRRLAARTARSRPARVDGRSARRCGSTRSPCCALTLLRNTACLVASIDVERLGLDVHRRVGVGLEGAEHVPA